MTHLKDCLPLIKDLGRKYRNMERRFMQYRVFLTAVELNLFDLLTAPQSAMQLSERAGTHSGLTKKLLDVLVAIGFVVKTHEGYCNTEEATAFLTDGDAYFSAGSVDFLKGNYELFDALTDRVTQGPKRWRRKNTLSNVKGLSDCGGQKTMMGQDIWAVIENK